MVEQKIKNICFSGGAKGSDKLWGELASELGHAVCHYSFSGHSVSVPKRFVEVLSQEMLNEADESLKIANKTLKRSFPTSKEYVNNLLRRNYWQIKNTESVYAITDLDENCLPYGGTAWAVQMAIDKNISVFLYSPAKKCWFEQPKECSEIDISNPNLSWISGINTWHMLGIDPPKPKGKWTGIGTRSLTEDTKTVINNLMLE